MPNLQSIIRQPSLGNNDKNIASGQLLASPLHSVQKAQNATAKKLMVVPKPQLVPGALPVQRDKKLGRLPMPASPSQHRPAKLPISPLVTRSPAFAPQAANNNDNAPPGSPSESEARAAKDAIIKPSLKRYIMLFLFCLNSSNKAFQWIQIPAATEKVTYFYEVENFVINSMSVIFMLTFVVASWPACYLIEHVGVRRAVVMASFGTSLGSLIKCFSCHEQGIHLLFIGQTLVSFSEQLIFSVPSRLASVWFPDHQVSSAVAISVLGTQLGVALGFVVPQFALDGADSKESIGDGLWTMFVGTAIFSLGAFVASFLLFDEAPKYAPGAARLKQIAEERQQEAIKESFIGEMRLLGRQIRHLLDNKHFNLLSISYGITIGIGYALSTVLNQMLEPLWPQDDLLVGNTGFIIVISGAICSPLWGRLLDKKHRYLLIYELLMVATITSLLLFGIVVSGLHSRLAIYLAAALFGSFQTGLLVGGLELAVELTYPAAELVTSSFMNVPPQIFGTVFVFVASYLVDSYGAVVTNLFFILCFILALTMSLNIRETLRRQSAVLERKNLPPSELARRC